MNEFESNLNTALFEARMTYRQVEHHDWERYYKDRDDLVESGKYPNVYLIPREVLNWENYRYPEPKVTEQVSEGTAEDGDSGRTTYYDFAEILECSGQYGVDIDGFGTAYFKESYGGEGLGDQYWLVFKLVNGAGEPRYFKLDGYYASYDGGYYDNFYEVWPKMVMRTEWGS